MLVASCDVFDPRSDELTCTITAECDAPRTCASGYCIIPAALLPDADTGRGDAPDADSSAPDANTSIADADPMAPDAGPGECDPLTPTIAMSDDFADGVATPLWDVLLGQNLALAEAGGVLALSSVSPPPGTRRTGYRSLLSNYVLTDKSFYVELPSMHNETSDAAALVRLGVDPSNKLEFQQSGGTLSVVLTVATTPATLASLSYDASAHRWWRVVDSGGTFEVQTSADAELWVTQGTASTPSFFGAVEVSLLLEAEGGGSAIGALEFDNVNTGIVVCTP